MAPAKSVGIAALPKKLFGQVRLPVSKSLSNRVLVLEHLTKAGIFRGEYSDAHDTHIMQKVLEDLSAGVRHIHVGDAGTVARFITAICALCPFGTIRLEGTPRMNQRPMEALLAALMDLGAQFHFHHTPFCMPFTVQGVTTKHGQVVLTPSQSSQFLSALLLMAPVLPLPFTIVVPHHIPSRPYVSLTCSLLSYYGYTAQWTQDRIILDKTLRMANVPVANLLAEADWSAAIYFILLAGLVPGSSIRIPGLFPNSLQGDGLNMARVLAPLGLGFEFDHNGLKPMYFGEPNADLSLDFSDCPDLAQPVACYVVAKGAKGRLTGLGTLPHKETDRLSALCLELAKTGTQIWHTGDSLEIGGPEGLNPDAKLIFDTHDDHRMAMALSLLLCKFVHARIQHPSVVTKSFPDYWTQLSNVGVSIIQYP